MLYRLGIFLLDIQQGIFHFGDKAEVHEQLEVGEKQETLWRNSRSTVIIWKCNFKYFFNEKNHTGQNLQNLIVCHLGTEKEHGNY